MAILEMTQYTDEWHEERRKGVGGSDVADVLNLAPYGCSARLWDEKRGLPEDYPETWNPHMERGKRLEEIIRGLYSEAAKKPVYTPNQRPQPTPTPIIPYFMRGNVDGLIGAGFHTSYGVLECKAPARQSFMELKRNGLPESWILQMQHYLCVYGLSWGAYAILWAEGWEFLTFEVQRDEALIQSLLAAEDRFWRLVENGPRPPRLGAGDPRCARCRRRVSCLGLDIASDAATGGAVGEDEGGEKIIYEDATGDDALADKVTRYIEAQDGVKAAEVDALCARAELEAAMGKRHAVRSTAGKVLWKPVTMSRFDIKAFEKAHPDLRQKFIKTTESRPLRVFPIGVKSWR